MTSPMASASSPLHMPPKSAISLARAMPDQPGQEPRGAVVEGEPAAGEDHGELGPVAADDQVAAERQGEPGAHGVAVDLGDGGLGQPVQRQRHVAQPAHARPGASGRCPGPAPVGSARSAPEQKDPPAPVRTITRSSGLGSISAKMAGSSTQHDGVGRVLSLGAVHGDGDHAALAFDDESFHGA